MKNISQMMKQAQEMQKRIEEMQKTLESIEIVGEAGGGLVKVTLNGKGSMIRIAIDDDLLSEDDSSILEDLIVAAHSDAKNKIEQHTSEEMKNYNSKREDL